MFGSAPIQKPLVIAHRGASAVAVENTIPAFLKAYEIGADGIEFDIQLTRDKQLVVFHDSSVERLTNSTGLLSSYKAAELRGLSLRNDFSDELLSIPTLEEVLVTIPEKTLVNVEVKSNSLLSKELVRNLAKTLSQISRKQRFIVSSFNILQLFWVKRELPDIKLGLLSAPGISPLLYQRIFRKLLDHYSLHPYKNDVTKKLVSVCHQHGTQVISYTINRTSVFSKFIHYNIDGIFTDDPQMMIEHRKLVLRNE